MGRPDMATPIAYALCYPDRPLRATPPLDLAEIGTLTFRRPQGRFARAVNLGYEAIRRGPAGGAVLNGANEAAVRAFLAGEITFGKIVPLVEDILNGAPAALRRGSGQAAGKEVDLDTLVEADAWARREVARAVSGP
jgi:1-deoxy-D-xylulose-5-phosphate reductoisomerase